MYVKKYYSNSFNVDQVLLSHIAFELGSLNNCLVESHGYYNNISDIIHVFEKKIRLEVYKLKDDDEYRFTFNDMSLFKDIRVFFTGYNLTVNVKYFVDKNNDINQDRSGGSYDDKSEMIFSHKNILFSPNIEVHAEGSSKSKIMNSILKTIGHEFIHAYNDYKMFKRSLGKFRLNDIYYQHDYNLSLTSENDIEKSIAYILYLTDKSEKNANIGQLKAEIDQYSENIWKTEDLVKAIESTDAYKKLKKAEELVVSLERLDSKEDQLDIITVVSALSGFNFNNVKQAINFLKSKVTKFRNKFNDQSTKIACDVYLEKKKRWI